MHSMDIWLLGWWFTFVVVVVMGMYYMLKGIFTMQLGPYTGIESIIIRFFLTLAGLNGFIRLSESIFGYRFYREFFVSVIGVQV